MTTIDRLNGWKTTGVITGARHEVLSRLVRKDRVSVFLELSGLLYLGVLFFVGGAGWAARAHVADLGDATILSALTLTVAAAFYYCVTRAEPYHRREVESPNMVFDYVLYLGCLLLASEAGYLEYRFELFRNWHHHLLIGAAVFGVLAYRFDNRFVLSLALSSLAGWLGVGVASLGPGSPDALRLTAWLYAALIGGVGTWLHRQDIKAHFVDVYLHLAANVILAATASGLGEPSMGLVYLGALIALSTASIVMGVRFRRFAFVTYGTLYGYGAISYKLLATIGSPTLAMLYFVVTGTMVIIALVVLARRFGRDE